MASSKDRPLTRGASFSQNSSRQRPAPGKLPADLQPVPGCFQKIGGGIVPRVHNGHGGVKVGKHQPLVLPALGQSLLDFRQPGAKGGLSPLQLGLNVSPQFLRPAHRFLSSFPAARIFSGSARHSVYSSKPGSPMLTRSFR